MTSDRDARAIRQELIFGHSRKITSVGVDDKRVKDEMDGKDYQTKGEGERVIKEDRLFLAEVEKMVMLWKMFRVFISLINEVGTLTTVLITLFYYEFFLQSINHTSCLESQC